MALSTTFSASTAKGFSLVGDVYTNTQLDNKKLQPYPAIILCHGLGATRQSKALQVVIEAIANASGLEDLRIITFDFQGCGESGGETSKWLTDLEEGGGKKRGIEQA